VGDENWVPVAVYCDECPVLKKHTGKEDVEYPVSVEQTLWADFRKNDLSRSGEMKEDIYDG